MKTLTILLFFVTALACASLPCMSRPQGAGYDSANPYPPFTPSDDEVAQTFDTFGRDIGALRTLYENSQITPNSPPDFTQAEKLLVYVGKDIDRCMIFLQAFGLAILNEDATADISDTLTTAVGDIQAITDAIISQADVLAAYGADTLVVRILTTFAPAFDRLYNELAKHLYANAAQTVAPRLLDMICLMNNAANALIPGSGVTDAAYCNTYGTLANPGNYDACLHASWPQYPVSSTPYDQCGQSCLSVFKFAYDQGCWNGYGVCVSITWCSSVNGVAFLPPPLDWTPAHWFCTGKGK